MSASRRPDDPLEWAGMALMGRTSPFYGEGGKVCNRRFSLISVRLGEGRLTSRQRSLSVPHGIWLPTAFADRLQAAPVADFAVARARAAVAGLNGSGFGRTDSAKQR